MKKLHALALPLLLALASCGGGKGDGSIDVTDAWVRLPPIPDRPGAAYFTLRNNGEATALTAVQSAKVQRIELHMTHVEGDMSHMMPAGDVPVPAAGTAKLQPGGLHAMLFGVDAGAKPGGTLPLTLVFKDGRKAEAEAKLVGVGDPEPGAN